MFSLKSQVRRRAMMFAAIAATVGFATISQAALYWNPDGTGSDAGFGSGSIYFNDGGGNPNSELFWSDASNAFEDIGTGNDVHFRNNTSGSPYSVVFNNAVSVRSLTLTGGYNLSGSAITLTAASGGGGTGGGVAGRPCTVIENTGINSVGTITIPASFFGSANINVSVIDVVGVEDVLTVNQINVTSGSIFRKMGEGVLRINGMGGVAANTGGQFLQINQGTVILNENNTTRSTLGALTVGLNGTLAGNGVVRSYLHQWDPGNRDARNILINGHLAPGDNGSTGGSNATGTFTFYRFNLPGTNFSVTLGSTSVFDMDLKIPGFEIGDDGKFNAVYNNGNGDHDILRLDDTANNGASHFNIRVGAKIDINDMAGPGDSLDGVYRIVNYTRPTGYSALINLFPAAGEIYPFNANNVICDFTDPAFDFKGVEGHYYDTVLEAFRYDDLFIVLGLDPDIYEYGFAIKGSGSAEAGIYLIITKVATETVPEPASLGLLGLGAGMLLLRRKR